MAKTRIRIAMHVAMNGVVSLSHLVAVIFLALRDMPYINAFPKTTVLSLLPLALSQFDYGCQVT